MKQKIMRFLAVLAATSLFVAACGNGVDETADDATDGDPTDDPVDGDPDDDEDTVEGHDPAEQDDEAAVDEDDHAAEEDDTAIEDAEDDADHAETADADGLLLGYVLPETGPLAYLGPPQIES